MELYASFYPDPRDWREPLDELTTGLDPRARRDTWDLIEDVRASGVTILLVTHFDETGGFDWSAPNREVHAFVNDLERPIGTYLYGRRLYDMTVPWETVEPQADQPEVADFADLWRAADTIVYSTTLPAVTSTRTRLERTFDPEAARAMKAAADRTRVSAAPAWRHRRSAPGWSTRSACSSTR